MQDAGLLNRAKDAITDGRLCVEQSLPMIRRLV